MCPPCLKEGIIQIHWYEYDRRILLRKTTAAVTSFSIPTENSLLNHYVFGGIDIFLQIA